MKRSKLPALSSALLLAIAVVIPALAQANSLAKPRASGVHVTLEWAAFTEDHAAVDYVIEGRFEVPAGYLPITCPLSKVQLFDAAGNDITGAIVTTCRAEGENKYVVTQFFYGDFQSRAPEKIELTVGDISVMPVGNGKIGYLPPVGIYSFTGEFKRDSAITVYPAQKVEQRGVSLAVNRVDFTPTTVKVDACIALPDNRDWVPEAYLSVGGMKIPVDEWFIPNFREDPGIFEGRERCYTFLFYTQVPDFRRVDRGAITFSIDEVYTNIPECVDVQGLAKIKQEMEKYGFQPKPDQSGYYCFMREIATSTLDEADKAALFEYIGQTLPEHVQGPFEVEIH